MDFYQASPSEMALIISGSSEPMNIEGIWFEPNFITILMWPGSPSN